MRTARRLANIFRHHQAGREPKPPHGFTLAEVLITVGLAAVLLAVYSVLLTSTFFLRRSQYYVQVANFIQEELDTLRTLDYDDLLLRDQGDFLGLPIQRGDWHVEEESGGDGQGNRLVLSTPPPATGGETGLIIVPHNWRGDFTFSAKVKVDDASPAGWGGGLAFRYVDVENHYRFRFAAGGIALDKVSQGVSTTVWSDSATYDTDTWYTLEVIAAGNEFTLKRNGSTLTTYTDSTDPFLLGDLALVSLNLAKTSFDDVAVTETAGSPSWDFESDPADELPDEWRRLSWYDLPSGQGTLTIENYLSEASIKKATVFVRWDDGGTMKTVSGSTLIGN